jgi:hypothetical protein
MKRKYINKILLVSITLFVFFLLIGCQSSETLFDDIEGYNQGLDSIISEQVYTSKKQNSLTDSEEDFVDSSLNDFKEFNTATVVFNNNQAEIINEVENTDIFMENGNLIVNSTRKMTLVVSGTLNGSIIINKTDGKLKLVLNGVTINSESGPAINLQTEKRVFLVINDQTVNHVTDGNEHPLMSNGSKTKAAIFSEEQLIISGNGELNVRGRYQHGIASDDYIKILSGKINILSAESDGLRANDYIVIDGGEIDITAKGDGIECEKGFIVINGGFVKIRAEKNGIKALYEGEDTSISTFIHIHNGLIDLISDEKGIASNHDVVLYNGAVSIQSSGDSVFAQGHIRVEDGMYFFNSQRKQVLDGQMGVSIIDGTLLLYSEGNEAALQSKDGQIVFEGGTIIVAGAIDLNVSASTQGYVKIGNVQKNEIIQLKNQSSILIAGFLNPYNHIIISTQEINPGDTYEIYSSGQIQGNNFYGLYLSGSYLNGSVKKTVKAN